MSQDDTTARWRPRPPSQSSPTPQQQPSSQPPQPRRTDSRNRTNFPSPSTPTNGRTGAWNGVDSHVPVNGYNAKEVEEYMAKAYNEALAAATNKDVPEGERPKLYKGPESGWTTASKSASPWGPKLGTMANGQDFLAKLKKGVQALNEGKGTMPAKDGKEAGKA